MRSNSVATPFGAMNYHQQRAYVMNQLQHTTHFSRKAWHTFLRYN